MAATPDEVPRSAISDEEVSALLEKGAPDAVRAFDLSTRRINRTELPALDEIGKSFAERATSSLSALLSRPATVKFDGLQRGKAADVQASLPAPSGIAVARFKPLAGEVFVSIDPALLLTLLDGFFGGNGRVVPDPQAAVGPAAQRFFALLLRHTAGDFAAAWAPSIPLEFEFLRLETNPRLLRIGDALDGVFTLKFGVEFAAQSGQIQWVIPEAVLAPIREALASEGAKPAQRPQDPWMPALGAALQRADMEARAILAEARVSLGALVRLAPGDIIPIEPPQQVTLLAGDVPLYQGRFGISRGRNAIKILSRGPA